MVERQQKVVLIVQARMGSVRLPEKTMMPLAGKPMLSRMIERLRRCRAVDHIVIATTELPGDDVVADLARSENMSVFRGSENDLVDRYYQAALTFEADVVVRIPADNPVPEPSEIDRIIGYHLASDNAYSSNLAQVLGNGYPDGIGAEVMEFSALKEIWQRVSDRYRREHPHLSFYDYEKGQAVAPDIFKVGTVACPPDFSRPDIVLDVNTAAQYRFLDALYCSLYPHNNDFHITDIIAWCDRRRLSGEGGHDG
mgnify:CR=1 FL=1